METIRHHRYAMFTGSVIGCARNDQCRSVGNDENFLSCVFLKINFLLPPNQRRVEKINEKLGKHVDGVSFLILSLSYDESSAE